MKISYTYNYESEKNTNSGGAIRYQHFGNRCVFCTGPNDRNSLATVQFLVNDIMHLPTSGTTEFRCSTTENSTTVINVNVCVPVASACKRANRNISASKHCARVVTHALFPTERENARGEKGKYQKAQVAAVTRTVLFCFRSTHELLRRKTKTQNFKGSSCALRCSCSKKKEESGFLFSGFLR